MKIATITSGLFLCVLAMCHVGCIEENLKREDIGAFLTQYDPAMKARRDELVGGLGANNEQISKLRSLRNSYQSERARSFVTAQISKLEVQRDKLRALLADIDAQVEVAMASKAMNAVGGGGLKSTQSRELIKQADQLLKQSNDLSTNVTSLFSEARPHDTAPRTPGIPSKTPASRTQPPADARTAVIKDRDGWSNLRASPSMNGRIIRRIPADESFDVQGAKGNWRRVTTYSGEEGWMHTSVIRFTDS